MTYLIGLVASCLQRDTFSLHFLCYEIVLMYHFMTVSYRLHLPTYCQLCLIQQVLLKKWNASMLEDLAIQ